MEVSLFVSLLFTPPSSRLPASNPQCLKGQHVVVEK